MMTREKSAQFLYRFRIGYLIFTNAVAVIGLGIVLNLLQLRMESPSPIMAEAVGAELNPTPLTQATETARSNRVGSIFTEPTPTLSKGVEERGSAISQNRLDQPITEISPTPQPENSRIEEAAVLTQTVTPTELQSGVVLTPTDNQPFPTIILENISPTTSPPSPTPIPPSPTPLPTPSPWPSQTPLPSPTPWPSEPGILSVPKINLLQQVQQVPVRDGNWDIGNLGDDVGLLQATGRHPHDSLSMAFVGHVTTVWPIGGPFEQLGHLSLGDIVQYQVGSELFVYEITRFLRVDPSRGDLLLNERGDQILLVTCDGYSLLTDQFSNRLIAQATLARTETIAMPDEIGQ